jgi:serine/threonine protein kinase
MSLALGARFGPYEVTDSIGSGGMGEVYRAVDRSLKRDVAIKVLPASFASDADRLARFQREAEVLAALNHPSIAHVYGLETAGGVHALVMELVPGETLADRLALGAIPVEEALTIAMQIASALEAAHDKGIVHRDLKPANIKLRPDGTAKVLDFGIAKTLAPHSGAHGPVTTAPAMTATGFVLGTAAYMSPEQARGKAVDERTDIWAFGCVLYEMLTGQRAFAADDAATTMARILQGSADLSLLPALVSSAVRNTLALCLQKDVKKRIADIRDVRLALEGAFETVAPQQNAATSSSMRSRLTWLALGAVVSALAAAVAWRGLNEPAALPPEEMRLEVSTPATTAPLQFALSPDGRHLAFVASDQGQQRLWLRSFAVEEARPIAGTDGARYPFWSVDSRSIGYTTSGSIYRVSIAGGAPEKLVSVFFAGGAAFNAEGGLLYSPGSSWPLMYLPRSGGRPTVAAPLQEGHAGYRFPQFLPDGRRFLFYAAGEPEKSGVYLGSLDGGQPTRLTAADSAGAFLAPNWVLFAQQGALIARRVDLARTELKGEPVIVSARVSTEANGRSGFSVSTAGQVAFRTSGAQRSQLTWRDRAGAALGTAAEADTVGLSFPELSPDGSRVMAQRSVAGNWDIWWLDLERGSWSPLSRDPSNEQLPVWSPDSSRIAFSSNPSGRGNLYLRDARGRSSSQLLFESENQKQPQSWSSDGRLLLYYEIDPRTNRDLWSLDIDSGERRVIANSRDDERSGQFSPDGRWVAYETDASGQQFEVVVQSLTEPTARWAVSTRGGTQPRWSADSAEIYFISPELTMMAARVTAAPGEDPAVEIDTPVELFPVRLAGDAVTTAVKAQYAVAADGRFLINEIADDDADVPITLILNWAGAGETPVEN